MTMIIDGKKVADQIKQDLVIKTKELLDTKGIRPGLALLLVGDNAASQVYVNMKEKACKSVGYYSLIKRLPKEASENEVLQIIDDWNQSPEIHGILVQLPLPKHIDEQKVTEQISPLKDVDGFHPINVGKMLIGLPCFVPCTPAGIMELFKSYNISLSSKNVVVLGRSNIVGKPIAALMMQKNKYANATVTVCHSNTKNIKEHTLNADIIVVAMGVPEYLKSDMVSPKAVIIDVGTNRIDDKSLEKGYRLCGDADFKNLVNKVQAISPSPGGVGPMTIAMLLSNTFKSAIGEYGT